MATRTTKVQIQKASFPIYTLLDLDSPFSTYSTENITKKNTNKNVLLDLLGPSVDTKQLLVGVVLSKKMDDLDEDEKHMLDHLIEAMLHLDGVTPILISIENDTKIARHSSAPSFIFGTHARADLALLSGIDTFIFVDKEPRLTDFGHLLVSFGSGIIAHRTKTLPSFVEEYNPYKERGNSLLFATYDVWNAFAAVVRLKEIASFPYDWNTFRRVAMQSVQS